MFKLPSLRFCLAIFLNLSLLGTIVIATHLEGLPLQTTAPVKVLSKRGILQDLYARVPISNKVNTGAAASWQNKLDTAAVYAPTEFYGCTVVVVANFNGVVIGHFAQEKPGNVVCMQDAASVNSMIDKLQAAEVQFELEDVPDSRAWIVYSDDIPQTSPGYRSIFQNLQEWLFIPPENIRPIRYRRGGGGGESDKIVVQWTPTADQNGATLNVYIQSSEPLWTCTWSRLKAHTTSVCSLLQRSSLTVSRTAQGRGRGTDPPRQ